MDSKMILDFLRQVMMNNNRSWFQEHKAEYEVARCEFERGIALALERIISFDASIANLTVKDCTYRFYRDTRFSQDKSPYKNHFGAYINAKGKKALRGGYYIHLEPEKCLVACGNYWLPTNILTACRNEMMGNTDEWLKCVESRAFRKYYSAKEDAGFDDQQGFGLNKLKTCPVGFPRDWEHVKYLKLKDYCCWHHVSEDFFMDESWLDEMAKMFRAAKPMMDFMNSVIDDYE